jgi:hypothetical protein
LFEKNLENYPFLNGLVIKRRRGIIVRERIKAANIAIPIKIPKLIVGLKLERTNIENPNMIVSAAITMDLPTVS